MFINISKYGSIFFFYIILVNLFDGIFLLLILDIKEIIIIKLK